jgi:hypothetical protein
MKTIIITTFLALVCLPASRVSAQPGPDEDAMVASNVCQGATSEITRAQGGKISANVGQYKIEGANGSVTISKGDRAVFSGMTFDAFAKCLLEMKKGIAADRKATRIERQSAIFDLALSLSETLHMGTCLRGAAQVGLYPGDMSQGAGTIVGEDATYTQIASTENVLRQKAQNLFKRDLRFSLSDAVLFFRFVPGRSVPYFDNTTIGTANSLVAAQLVGNEQVVASMGRDIGAASKLARWYAILPNLVQMVAQRDPQRAYYLQPGVQQSQQCIVALYPDTARQVQSDFSAFGCNIAVPQLDTDMQFRAWRAVVDAARNCIQTKV